MCGMAPEYSCIVPLRLLALRRRDPALWARVQRLMDHDEERRRETKYWKMFQASRGTQLIMSVHRTRTFNQAFNVDTWLYWEIFR